ncbi:hypothetical protein NH8B_0513 [Pseudogulbenkiania sp. NH8B]|nr:hypothetical protein NH8B_0513 [Pseudogulbenkiania sp. NH8B]
MGCKVCDLVHYGATARIELVTPTPSGLNVVGINSSTGETDPPFVEPVLLVLNINDIRKIDLLGSVLAKSFPAGYEMWGRLPERIHAGWHVPGGSDDPREASRWSFIVSRDYEGHDTTNITVDATGLMVVSYELHRFKTGAKSGHGQQTSIEIEKANRDTISHRSRSDKLVALNQAFTKFWANATPDDRTTQPDNITVEKWLIEHHSYSATLAQKAASIIRPGWAGTGRRPEE